MTDGQRLALEQLHEVEALGEGALEVLSIEDGALVKVRISVRCTHLAKAPNGLPLRSREPLVLLVSPDFPFEHPSVWTPHRRFADSPHVQWSRHLCLYQAPSTEWDASDGMFGFLARLEDWLRQGALDQLDATGAPVHPPVAYPTSDRTVIPRVDAPAVPPHGWFGTAHLRIVSDHRADIVGWSPLLSPDTPTDVAAAVLLPTSMPFEYPRHVGDLIAQLEDRGISRSKLLLTLQSAVICNPEDAGLYVIVGAPMRGVRGGEPRQHLAAWLIEGWLAKGVRLSLRQYSEHEKLREIGREVEEIIWQWAAKAEVSWCQVREERPEIVTRRDHDSALSWFRGRSVAVWGCGALGSHLGDFLARAGVARLILRDSGTVAPGLLVRQLFDDADIGEHKAQALARRLLRVRDDLQVETDTSNLLNHPLGREGWSDDVDLVIDTTGSRAVLKKTELRWRTSHARQAIASMVVGPRAQHGLVVLARPGHSGGPYDVARAAKLAACADTRLIRFLDDFWPVAAHAPFQPEPGCSDPTFVGSAADAAVLAGAMLSQLALDLASNKSSAAAYFVAQPHLRSAGSEELLHAGFCWTAERTLEDRCAGYDVRISAEAWQAILACVEGSRRRRGWRPETGGLLFGERDDAARVIWITDASEPPQDSRSSSDYFLCGVAGTAEMNEQKRLRSRASVHFVGTWHTHPKASPVPSGVDLSGMAQIVTSLDPPISKALLLIVGHTPDEPTPAAYLFTRNDLLAAPPLLLAGRSASWRWFIEQWRLLIRGRGWRPRRAGQ